MESMLDIFGKKYDEFARDLQDVCPELTNEITAAKALSPEERRAQFKIEVLPFCSPSRNPRVGPEKVLPGVSMTPDIWVSLSDNSRKSIQEYLTLLSFTLLLETGPKEVPGWDASWAEKMMGSMKDSMKDFDLGGISEKVKNLFASMGTNADGIPQIPEKFLKGQIARLAEEIVKEFRVEDLGIDPADLEAAGNDPTKALNMITEIFSKNPRAFQSTIQKIGNKLQQKIQSGALRPKELVAEAEELMKTFSENPQFVDLMEGFRKAFNVDGLNKSTSPGHGEGERLSIVKERLRKKLDAKKKGSK
jgi:hypothetical protein